MIQLSPLKLVPVLLLLLTAACASRGITVREFVLNPIAAPQTLPPVGAAPGVAVGVGPVEIPAYLRRREIVVRKETNRLHASQANRWGEDLDSSVARVLAGNLAHLLPSNRVSVFPWQSRGPLQYRVAVQIERFERGPSGAVQLDARWSLAEGRGRETLAARATSIEESTASDDYASTVDAMSRALGRLASEISRSIREQAADGA